VRVGRPDAGSVDKEGQRGGQLLEDCETLSDPEAAVRYRTHVVALTGNVNDAARRLRLHRNTVGLSIDQPRLNRWKARCRPR
jgi:hypothetical protein